MRRLARGCSSESYGILMNALSTCISEWDQEDYDRLAAAKRGELMGAGVTDSSPAAIQKATSREELVCHCKRQTRRADETTNLIEALLLIMTCATDALGARLFNDDMMDIWEEQKEHIVCLQDPPGVSLYTSIGSIMKGGVTLPVLCCASGTTSLESFHLHLARYQQMVYNKCK